MFDFQLIKKARSGLRQELLLVVCLSTIFSVGLYMLLQPLSKAVLQYYYTQSDYLESSSDRVAQTIQQQLERTPIASSEVERLSEWYVGGEQRGGCILRVEKDGVILYDSSLTNIDYRRINSQASRTLSEETYLHTYPLYFLDGEATLYLYGYFDFFIDELVRTVEFWFCCLLGISAVLYAVWKKISYVEKLEQSIRVLEGGDLDYLVPVQGEDELAGLAQSLNDMRKSFQQRMEEVRQAERQRSELVTALSHDLRTPLTTQLGYLEILQEGHYQTQKQHDEYLKKCICGCQTLIDLSNQLFRTACGEEQRQPALEPLMGAEVFVQIFMEKFFLLEEFGWQFRLEECPEKAFCVRVNTELLCRIADNLLSNLKKYASSKEPIRISLCKQEKRFRIEICNQVDANYKENDSHGVGLKNVQQMMRQMEGICFWEYHDDHFLLWLEFPCQNIERCEK